MDAKTKGKVNPVFSLKKPQEFPNDSRLSSHLQPKRRNQAPGIITLRARIYPWRWLCCQPVRLSRVPLWCRQHSVSQKTRSFPVLRLGLPPRNRCTSALILTSLPTMKNTTALYASSTEQYRRVASPFPPPQAGDREFPALLVPVPTGSRAHVGTGMEGYQGKGRPPWRVQCSRKGSCGMATFQSRVGKKTQTRYSWCAPGSSSAEDMRRLRVESG